MLNLSQLETLRAVRMPRTGTPMEIGRKREADLAAALLVIADAHGVQLQKPLGINSNGEFTIYCVPVKDGGVGSYQNGFADLLNQHNPRCGMSPGAHLFPEHSWCWINHFDVERLVLAYCDRQEEQLALEAQQPEPLVHQP